MLHDVSLMSWRIDDNGDDSDDDVDSHKGDGNKAMMMLIDFDRFRIWFRWIMKVLTILGTATMLCTMLRAMLRCSRSAAAMELRSDPRWEDAADGNMAMVCHGVMLFKAKQPWHLTTDHSLYPNNRCSIWFWHVWTCTAVHVEIEANCSPLYRQPPHQSDRRAHEAEVRQFPAILFPSFPLILLMAFQDLSTDLTLTCFALINPYHPLSFLTIAFVNFSLPGCVFISWLTSRQVAAALTTCLRKVETLT